MRRPPPATLDPLPRRGVSGGWRVTTTPRLGTYSRVPSRFAPAGDRDSGVIYLADSAASALAEYFRSVRSVGVEAFRDRVLLEVSFGREFSLADLGSKESRRQLDVERLTRDPVYEDSQALATRLLEAGYDGIAYPDGGTGSGRLLALFGRVGIRVAEKAEFSARAVEFGDAERLGVTVVGPAQAAT